MGNEGDVGEGSGRRRSLDEMEREREREREREGEEQSPASLHSPLAIAMADLDAETAACLSPEIPLGRAPSGSNGIPIEDAAAVATLSYSTVFHTAKEGKNVRAAAVILTDIDNGRGGEEGPSREGDAEPQGEQRECEDIFVNSGSDVGNRTGTEKREGEDEGGRDGDVLICRVCHFEVREDGLMLQCGCKKSMAVTHMECAQLWFSFKGDGICEICSKPVLNLPPCSLASTKGDTAEPPPPPECPSFCPLQLRERALQCIATALGCLTLGVGPCLQSMSERDQEDTEVLGEG